METEQSIERERRRRSVESHEVGYENKEGKEDSPELAKAAAMERAEQFSKEIKSSKKQMQNILLHMNQVTLAIRQLRQQLQLAQDDDDPTSVAQDKEKVAELKKKISYFQDEMINMRHDLIREQVEELKGGFGKGMAEDILEEKATKMVDTMIEEIKK
jgi:hypothetical protein